MGNKLSVVIITHNEEKNIERCISSVKSVADDIVIVDSFSTDNTADICQSLGIQFFQHEWMGFSEQKNYANSLAKYDWIFSIDADEALSEELQNNILLAKKNDRILNYRICRITNYCGKWIHHLGWYPDLKIRFFDRTQNFWIGFIHERLNIADESSVPILKGDCYHFSYNTIRDHYERVYEYSEIMAKSMLNREKKFRWTKLLISPPFKFLKMYLIQRGFLDGFYGFVIAIISSYSVFLKYTLLKVMEKETKKS